MVCMASNAALWSWACWRDRSAEVATAPLQLQRRCDQKTAQRRVGKQGKKEAWVRRIKERNPREGRGLGEVVKQLGRGPLAAHASRIKGAPGQFCDRLAMRPRSNDD
ncbi:hypothetical protein LX32DRAFT_251979 [Colletotrichum zoysiae]|uniref:Uncharacterized protein n=1 Tax=Colletotrichum zoysiae TaxID=1216348 RepID=A0AAD9LU90_9PEZI|nr:hypothetical protein LX32DRAFT_251979 [Colletotrichum zoysiae]